ncbi:MAG: hypothetical protein WA721_06975 [Candidatus Binataceae bacterium]
MNACASITSTPFFAVGFDTHIADTIAELSTAAFPDGLRSVVLTGSLARGEGTWIREDACVRLAGDADVFAIFDGRAALPSAECVTQLQNLIEDRLRREGVEAHIGLSPVRSDYLRRLQPNIFSYELTTHAKVVWGDQNILKLAPAFTAADIPLEDGVRLLMNRMIELLEAVCEVDPPVTNAPAVRYRAIKLQLDMATSYLLFQRNYVPTYRGRAARLSELAAEPSNTAPIPLPRFAKTVLEATRCKLSEFIEMREFADLDTLIDDAHSLWRWELECLTGTSASDTDLLDRWIVAEPIPARMRGWAGVAMRSGAARAIVRMPKWIAIARKGSPRRLIYAAASELLFALPGLLEEDAMHGGNSRWDKLRNGLPITASPENSEKSNSLHEWRHLGRAISFNYNFFLAPPRT